MIGGKKGGYILKRRWKVPFMVYGLGFHGLRSRDDETSHGKSNRN